MNKLKVDKKEKDKLIEIKASLMDSKELQIVSKRRDMAEFESLTNHDFNRQFETDAASSGAFKVRPIMLSRKARREASIRRASMAQIDEQKV